MNAEVESGESDARHRCSGYALGMAGFVVLSLSLGTGNQPDSEDGKGESEDRPAAGRAFERNINQRGDGGTQQGADGSREAHVSRGQGAVENGDRESSDHSGSNRPEDAGAIGEGSVLSERYRQHQRKSADVRERCEHKSIGPARAVSAGEVGRSPEEYGSHRISSGRKLWQGRHAGRG